MLPTPEDRRAQTRRVAAALLELGADALALAVRATTGRRLREPTGRRSPSAAVTRTAQAVAAVSEAGASSAPPHRDSGEDAAARIDAARERLRSRIAAPADEDPKREPPAGEQEA